MSNGRCVCVWAIVVISTDKRLAVTIWYFVFMLPHPCERNTNIIPCLKTKKNILRLYTLHKKAWIIVVPNMYPPHISRIKAQWHTTYMYLKMRYMVWNAAAAGGAVLYSTTKMPNNAWNVLLNWHSLQHHHSVTRGETSLASNCSLSINLSQLCIPSFIWQISIFNCTLTPLWELYLIVILTLRSLFSLGKEWGIIPWGVPEMRIPSVG